MKSIKAGVLDIAYAEFGPRDGVPVILLHGFPYDTNAYADVCGRLSDRGLRSVVPSLRGYGDTRFLAAATPRSGQQAALGADLLALMDALSIPKAILAGYDWGGRAACIVSALWPERVSASSVAAPATTFRISPRRACLFCRKKSIAIGISIIFIPSAAASASTSIAAPCAA